MDLELLKTIFDKETAAEFKGWDFSYLTQSNRMQELPVSWDYRVLVEEALSNTETLLDLGTGGGEFLSSLKKLPDRTAATEGYLPNIPVARERLEPLGIIVKCIAAEQIPFEDAAFGLVINRHESYLPEEVYRVLKPGGFFITQQVGGLNEADLNMALGADLPQHQHWCLETAVAELENVGFTVVLQDEEITKTRFADIGALIFYLNAVPWQVEDFKWEKYKHRLLALAKRMQQKGGLDTICQRFIIKAIRS